MTAGFSRLYAWNLVALSLIFMTVSLPHRATARDGALHAQPWVFGQSTDRKAAIWHKGVNGATIAREKRKPQNEGDAKADAKQVPQSTGKTPPKGSLGFSMQKETSTWAAAPEQKALRADEGMMRERHNVLRAYAGVEAGDDFNINFGPELILKDDEHSADSANATQPDSALGLGMKFQYDF